MTDTFAITDKQPWADLIMAGAKPVENRSWPVPSTLPILFRCNPCGAERVEPHGQFNAVHDCTPQGTFWRVGVAPFRLGIHAGKQRDDAAEWLAWRERAVATGKNGATYGALLGFVTVTGCHHADECVEVRHPLGVGALGTATVRHCSEWAESDCFHWTLADPEPLDAPIPMKGKQRLWRLPDGVEPERVLTHRQRRMG